MAAHCSWKVASEIIVPVVYIAVEDRTCCCSCALMPALIVLLRSDSASAPSYLPSNVKLVMLRAAAMPEHRSIEDAREKCGVR